MQIRQKLELRRLLAPELRQSLKILALPLLDLKNLVEEEMVNNPLLEETQSDSAKNSSGESGRRAKRSSGVPWRISCPASSPTVSTIPSLVV